MEAAEAGVVGGGHDGIPSSGAGRVTADRARRGPGRAGPSLGTLWCQATLLVMNEIGWPLWVWAITKVGLPGRNGAADSTSSSSPWSWPLTSTTANPKAAAFCVERVEVVGLPGGGALLQPVAVHDHRQRVELVLRGRHHRLPVGALLQLAVAGEHVGAAARHVELGRDGVADGDGQAVAERPGVGLDARDLVAVGVPVQPGQRLQERGQLLDRRGSRTRPASCRGRRRRGPWTG